MKQKKCNKCPRKKSEKVDTNKGSRSQSRHLNNSNRQM